VTWRERQEQWRRFADWEAAQLRGAAPSLETALAWAWEAWQLARRFDPSWGSLETAPEHWAHLQRVRAALAGIQPRT